MAQYDGSIRINTNIAVKSAEKQLKSLENSMLKTAEKVASLRDKMESLRSVKIPTDEYKEIQKQISATETKLNSLRDRQEKFLEMGGKQESSTYKRMEYDAEQLKNTLQFARDEMQDLVDSGKAFALGSSTEEYSKLGQQLKYAEDSLEVMNQQHKILEDRLDAANQKRDVEKQKIEAEAVEEEYLAELRENAVVGNQRIVETLERIKELEKEITDLKSAGITEGYQDYDVRVQELESLKQEVRDYNNGVDNTKKSYGKLGQIAKRVLSKLSDLIGKLSKSTKKTNSLLSSTGMSFKNILKYGLGIRSVYALFSKFRSGVKEGFQNLAQYSNQTNVDISMLISSLLQLKNSLATAFAPILTVVAPILKSFISLLSQAATYVSHLMSALTGKSTYIKATEVQKDYAASLEATGKAAKEAAGSLSAYDKINPIQDKGTGSGGAGGGAEINPEDMFETLEVENSMKEFADKMKDALTNVFDVFKQAWDSTGKSVMDSAKAALKSLIDAAKAVGKTLYDVFTEGTGLVWVESSLNLLRTILDVIHAIADAFVAAWNSGAGLENITALFNMFTNINNLLSAIGDSFVRVFSNGIGVKIWTNILGIITGVYNIIGNLAKQLQIAWETAGTGDRIWSGILEIINTILETIHNIVDFTAEWATKLDFTPLLTSIATLLEALQPLTENIGAGLEWFWNNVLLPIAGWTIQEAVPTFLNMLSAAIRVVNSVIEVLKPLGIWLWENFLKPFGNWAGSIVISAMETITNLLQKLGDWILKHQEALQKFIAIAAPIATAILLISNAVKIASSVIGVLKIALTALINPIGLVIAAVAALAAGFVYLYEHSETFRNFIDGIIDGAKELIPGIIQGIQEGWDSFINWLSELWQSIVDGFKEFFGIHSPSKLMEEMGTYLLQGLIEGIKSLVGNVAEIWESMKETAIEKWENVKQSLSDIQESISEKSKEIWDGIIGFLSETWENLKKTASETWENIRSKFEEKFNAVSQKADEIKRKFSELKENVRDVFDSIRSKISGVVDSVIKKIESFTSKIKDAISAVKDFFSSGFEKIGSAVSGFFGGSSSRSISTYSSPNSSSLYSAIPDAPIPRLATGAVIPPNKEFLAVLGDQKSGTNIETPLDTMVDAFKQALKEMGGTGTGGGTGKVEIVLQIDRDIVARQLVDLNKQRVKSGGKPLFAQ